MKSDMSLIPNNMVTITPRFQFLPSNLSILPKHPVPTPALANENNKSENDAQSNSTLVKNDNDMASQKAVKSSLFSIYNLMNGSKVDQEGDGAKDKTLGTNEEVDGKGK